MTNDQQSLINDADPQETREWQESLSSVIEKEGAERAHFLIGELINQARETGIDLPYSATTEYINTIPVDRQPKYPGNPTIEIRIRNYLRWNAMAMVVKANQDTNVGGHIASFASSAALYDVGFNWFWRGTNEQSNGDLIFFQGTLGDGVAGNDGITHVALYVGDGYILNCGNPISYADLSRAYWQEHFYGFGRMYE